MNSIVFDEETRSFSTKKIEFNKDVIRVAKEAKSMPQIIDILIKNGVPKDQLLSYYRKIIKSDSRVLKGYASLLGGASGASIGIVNNNKGHGTRNAIIGAGIGTATGYGAGKLAEKYNDREVKKYIESKYRLMKK